MPNQQIYTDALKVFQTRYNMGDYDLDELKAFDPTMVENFFTRGVVGRSQAEEFISMASRTLTMYFEKNTTINEKGKYMSSFNPNAFLKDFEKLVDAKHRSELDDPTKSTRAKFDGASIDDIDKSFVDRFLKMNKPLPTLWFERIRKGTMSVDELKHFSANAFDSINKVYFTVGKEGDALNVVAAYETMKQLRESRNTFFGWFWKRFNFRVNAREKAYLEELKNQVNGLKEKGFDVGQITLDLTKITVMGKGIDEKLETVERKEVKKASPAKNKAKEIKLKPVADTIKENVTSEFLLNMAEKFSEELQLDNMGSFARIAQYNIALQNVNNKITDLNYKFDDAVANGNDANKEMAKVVNATFKEVVKAFSEIFPEDERVEYLKTAAGEIINKLTPASKYSKELGEVVNTYIDKNIEVYREIVAAGKEYETEILNYDDELRMPAFSNDEMFKENDNNKGEPVPEAISKNPLILEN